VTPSAVLPMRKPAPDAPRGTRLSDTGNAERFVMQHGADLRYCYRWNAWICFTGTHWRKDESGEVERRAKATVKHMLAEAFAATDGGDRDRLAKHALRSDHKARIQAMIDLARSEPGIAIAPEDFDVDEMLLTVRNGTIDLRTGQIREHRREDYITKRVPCAYDPAAKYERFAAFLVHILASDADLIGFLQRAVGYTLTGSIREHCFFLLHGGGANGKSTLLEVLRKLLGDLATNADFATFLERKSERGPRDLARFFGARLVTAIESNEGRRFDESALKSITGGDTITACEIYEKSFEFTPTFKIWLAANHRPVVRGTDGGMWRRIRLIPFQVDIPESEWDKELKTKLLAELPGILRWAVEGCLAWQRDGLGSPERVASATAAYRAEMDVLGDFLRDRCEVGRGFTVSASALYAAYKAWAADAGEHAISSKALSTKLLDRGFHRAKSGTVTYSGLRVSPDDSGRSGPYVQNLPMREDIGGFQTFLPDRPESSGIVTERA
jgi:putative DNA primase/helicase